MGSAIILEGHANGLGLIRALGKEGLDVYLLDENKYNIGRYSKYCKKFLKPPYWTDEPERFVEYLEKEKEKLGLNKPVIFPTHNDQVYVLSKYKDRLKENFLVTVPDWEVTEKCYNKIYTYKIAEEIGIPIPDSYYVRDGVDLQKVDELLDYPFIIKPGIMHRFYEHTGKKAFKVDDFDELKEKYEEACEAVDPDELIFQEIIPGGPENLYSHGCFFKDGEEVRSLTKISRRQVPMDFGTSTYVEKVESDEVQALSKKILRKIDYYGMCEVEFKKDPRDGEYKFFEINPRPWKWHSLFLANGINVPYLVYKDLNGEKIDFNSDEELEDIKWIDIHTDVYISLKEIMRGKLRIGDYLSSIKNKKTFSVFQNDDIKPFVMETLLLPYLYLKRT